MRSVHTTAYKAFLVRLVAARGESGLTQGEAALRLGMPQSRLSRMESGERRIDIIELAEIARLYSKSLSYFVPLARSGGNARAPRPPRVRK